MSARAPYFVVREMHPLFPVPHRYWLVDFRSGNHANVFNGQRWHSKRAALHAIALIDPTSQHPVVIR